MILYPSENRRLIDHLSRHSKWPKVAVHLWALALEHASPADNEVMLTLDGMAGRIGCHPRAVSGALKELVLLRALIRQRLPEPGKQGRGTVQYFVNPRIASQLKKDARETARRHAPPLNWQRPQAVAGTAIKQSAAMTVNHDLEL